MTTVFGRLSHQFGFADRVARYAAAGTVIAHLLEVMTNKKIRGIDRRPKSPLAVSANLSILWAFMKKQEQIELGGINTTGATL